MCASQFDQTESICRPNRKRGDSLTPPAQRWPVAARSTRVRASTGGGHRRLAGLAVLLLAQWLSVDAQAATVAVNGQNLGSIPDGMASLGPGNFGPPRDVTFDVSGQVGTVSKVVVSFQGNHPFVGDLRVTLIAPNGLPHVLLSRTGATTATGNGSSANLVSSNTYSFSDQATVNWWTHVATTGNDIASVTARTTIEGGDGTSAPAAQTSLNVTFGGTPANGRWTLRFEDGSSFDMGAVSAATLSLETTGIDRVVTTDADSGPGSLRTVLGEAQEGDRIGFAASFFNSQRTIELQSALPTIDRRLAITGPGADRLTIRRAHDASDFSIFALGSGATTVSLSGMKVSNGNTDAFGGGIYSERPLSLVGMHIVGNRAGSGAGLFLITYPATILNSTISANRATTDGAGIYYSGTAARLRLLGSTVSDNHAGSRGGGVQNDAFDLPSTLEIANSTIVGNRAPDGAGGIGNKVDGSGRGSALVTLRNTITADNLPNNHATSASGGTATIASRGFNLSNDYNAVLPLASDRTGAARLGPLALYGGSVPTRPLLAGSLALDSGNSRAGAPLSGARGESRVFDIGVIANPAGGDGADIGAVEMQAIMVSNANDSGSGSLRQAITNANSNGVGLDDILFAEPFFLSPRTIPLASALPEISSAVTLNGPGAHLLAVRRQAEAEFRLLSTLPQLAHVTLSGMTLSNGRAPFGGGIASFSPLTVVNAVLSGNRVGFGQGGAIYVRAGDVWIIDSTLAENHAGEGGGIASAGLSPNARVLIDGSTLSGNVATKGAAVFLNSNHPSSTVDIRNSTFANNLTDPGYGNVQTFAAGSGYSGLTLVRNSIFSNPGPATEFGTSVLFDGVAHNRSLGFNLIRGAGDNLSGLQPSDQINAIAGLAELANNGGPTPTHALLITSDALDAGNGDGSRSLGDQRGAGFARSVDLAMVSNMVGGDGTDIGAFEAQSSPARSDSIFANGFD